jgi:hypothetical protein
MNTFSKLLASVAALIASIAFLWIAKSAEIFTHQITSNSNFDGIHINLTHQGSLKHD